MKSNDLKKLRHDLKGQLGIIFESAHTFLNDESLDLETSKKILRLIVDKRCKVMTDVDVLLSEIIKD